MTEIWRDSKESYEWTYWVVIVCLVVCLIIQAKDGDGSKDAPLFVDRIPTIVEVQILLGVKPDGVVGPKMIAAWKLAENNQHAARYNWMYKGVKP